MNWKRYFSQTMIDRGYEYYVKGKVKGVTKAGDTYKATILGTHVYHTQVRIVDDSIYTPRCDCLYAQGGLYCKHMTALLHYIEQTEMTENHKEKRETKIIPVFSPVKNSYQYFMMDQISNHLELETYKVEEAKHMIEQGKILLDSIRVDYRHTTQGIKKVVHAKARYLNEDISDTISCLFTKDNFLQSQCGVVGCRSYHYGYSYSQLYAANVCVHQLAMYLLVEEHLEKYNPGDSTDYDGATILSRFRSREGISQLEQLDEENKDLSLEPVLESERDKIYLSLKAGVDKVYVVKNIGDFIARYESKDTITFGTRTTIDLASHRLKEEAQQCFEFVRQIIREENIRSQYLRNQYGYYYQGEDIKQRVSLYGKRVDQLFELYQGKKIDHTDKTKRKTEKKTCLFTEEKPRITLTISKNLDKGNRVHGIQVTGKVPEFFEGEKYKYFWEKDSFCRIPEEIMEVLGPLFEVEDGGRIFFEVGRRSLSEFYHHVLPMLKENVFIKQYDREVIEELIPPDAAFSFYLDAQDEHISCKTYVEYDEDKYSLLEHRQKGIVFPWFRNLVRERDVLTQTEKLFPIVNLEEDELQSEQNEDTLVSLLEGGIERLMILGEVNTTERFRKMNIRKRPKLTIGVAIKSDLMNLKVSSEDLEEDDLLQLLNSYQRKKKYYRLKNGDLITVNEQDMEMLQQIMETLQISPKEMVKGKMKIPMYRALYLNKMLEKNENIYLNRDKHFKRLIKEFKTVDDSEFEVSDQLKKIMRGYQIHGFKWLKTLESYGFGGILADDMGLGKTLQAISLLQDGRTQGEEKKTALIVSPASLVYNWKEELTKYAPGLEVNLVVGNQQDRIEVIKNYKNYDVLITSYDLLKRDIAEYQETEFTYQIIDEAQYIKNHTTAAAKAVKVIHSKHRFALTGTPIENRLSELWSIFDYLMPGFLYGYEIFRKEIETPIVKYKEEEASQRLKKMVSPFILRRLKGDVLSDLPEKLEEIRYAKLEKEQQRLYDGQVIRMRNMLQAQKNEDFQKNKLKVLAELTKIRQICCDPELLFQKYSGGSAKREACMELIKSALEGEHRLLVFSQFTSMLELLETELKKENISYYKITGETPKQKRVEMVNDFNTGNTPVFLISLKAGGTGLNLTGADVVIHYDPWWNQAAQNQATDRAHRIGQTKTVTVYKLIVKGTIEEKIVKMQETKKDLADAILSGENGSITQMSKEEIMELL